MKILSVVVGIGARSGGIAPFVGGSATELEGLGASVRILSTDLALAPWGWVQAQRRITPAEWHPSLRGTDIRVFPARFPRRLARSPGLARELRRTVSEFDVVHIHNLWQLPQLAAFRDARRSGVPYIVSPHGGLDPYLRDRGRVRKRMMTAVWQGEMLEHAARVHVTTEGERSLIADIAPGVPRSVVPCGLYVEEFSSLPRRDEFRRGRLGGYDGPLILFLGRITAKKGLDTLIRAFSKVRRVAECRLVIAGPDDEGLTPALHRVVRELDLDRDVHILEPIYGDERLAALSTADVWALASHTENFGIAVVEAMAAGRAVVITPGVNLSTEIAGADAGVVAEPTPDQFAGALLRVLGDEGLRARLELAAGRFAAGYDWSVVAPRLLEMYRDAAEAKPREPLSASEPRSR